MADTRIFRITYDSGTVRYGNRITVSGAASYSRFQGGGHRKGRITAIAATDENAVTGWADVTAEFLGSRG